MAILSTKVVLLLTLCAKLATAQDDEDIHRPIKPTCTTTLTLTQSRLPTPPFWPQCSWDGTMTIYPSIVTINRSLDCHGCTDIKVTAVPRVNCPAEIILTSVRVPTPSTSYRTVCSATPTPRL